MSSDYLVQVIIPHDSGLPEDVSVNTWSCWTTATGDLIALADFMSELIVFYTAIDSYFSSLLDGPIQMKAYDRGDPEPRVPVITDTFNPTYGSQALPAEAAICMSFQGAQVSGLSQARRRGRVYLGPLSTNAADFATGRPAAACISAIAAAGDNLLSQSLGAADWNWNVWSQANSDGVPVDNGWVDNEWDTMRSRGRRPTSRSLFP